MATKRRQAYSASSLNSDFSYAGSEFEVYSAGEPWSVNMLPEDVIRFEIRTGDQYESSEYSDPAGVERAVISDLEHYPIESSIHIEYSFMIEPGAANTARWLVLGSLHARGGAPAGGSAPFEVSLSGERLTIYGNTENAAGKSVYQELYRDTTDLVRGRWYDIEVEVLFDASGDGYANVWRNGSQIVDFDGSIGYFEQYASNWRQGIYRSTAPETIAINYKDLSIDLGSDNPRPNNSGPVVERGTRGADHLIGAGTDDLLSGQGGGDRLAGRGGDDVLRGDQGRDVLIGEPGEDELLGGRDDANDFLNGGGGDDRIAGGRGNDELRGGTGRDRFIFDDRWGRDRLEDFNPGAERIDLRAVAGLRSFDDIEQRDGRGGDAVAIVGRASIVFEKVDWNDLDRGDFIL